MMPSSVGLRLCFSLLFFFLLLQKGLGGPDVGWGVDGADEREDGLMDLRYILFGLSSLPSPRNVNVEDGGHDHETLEELQRQQGSGEIRRVIMSHESFLDSYETFNVVEAFDESRVTKHL